MATRQAMLSMRRILLIFKLGIIIGLIVVFAWSISALEYGDYLRITAPLDALERYDGMGMAAMSDDGNIVLFEAFISDPIMDFTISYFLFNRQTETLTPVDIESSEQLPFRLSATGRYLLYETGSLDMSSERVWLRDLHLDIDEMVSVNTTGGQPNDGSTAIGISPDGRYAVFASRATNLVDDMTDCNQLFVRDLLNNTTVCVPVATEQGAAYIYDPYNNSAILSGDGSKLYYIARVNQCCYDFELFVYDFATQITTPIDVTFDDNAIDYVFFFDAVSYDGSLLTFTAYQANNIVPGVSGGQVFYIYDSATSSVTAWDAYEQGLITPSEYYQDYYVTPVSISDSGRYIWGRLLTQNPYSNLQLSGVSSPASRIDKAKSAEEDGLYLFVNFVYDRETNTTTQILVNENTTELGNPTGIVDVSADGEIMFLGSDETTLVPDDTNDMFDLFLAFLDDGSPDPTPDPTVEPTPDPTVEPTPEPTPDPTTEPTTEPTPDPTVEPTAEPTPEPTVTELLVNGNFEDNDNADVLLPDGWKKVGLLTQDRVKSDTDTTTFAHSAPNAFQIQGTKGEVGKVSKLSRNAKINGVSFTAGDTLTFSAMVDQRTGVPGTPIAKALVKYKNGSQQAMTLKLPNPKVVGYGEITVSKALNRGDVKTITVDLFYGNATGKFYIDDVSLTHTPVESAPLLAPLTLPSAPEN